MAPGLDITSHLFCLFVFLSFCDFLILFSYFTKSLLLLCTFCKEQAPDILINCFADVRQCFDLINKIVSFINSHPIQLLPPNPPHIFYRHFFHQRSRDLIEYLTKRGYSRTSLQRDANRVRSIPRHATLQPLEQKSAKTDRTSFNPTIPTIPPVVNKYATLLRATANCEKAFPNPPVMAYRRNASPCDLL